MKSGSGLRRQEPQCLNVRLINLRIVAPRFTAENVIIAISKIIATMKTIFSPLATFWEWKEPFERLSLVEKYLCDKLVESETVSAVLEALWRAERNLLPSFWWYATRVLCIARICPQLSRTNSVYSRTESALFSCHRAVSADICRTCEESLLTTWSFTISFLELQPKKRQLLNNRNIAMTRSPRPLHVQPPTVFDFFIDNEIRELLFKENDCKIITFLFAFNVDICRHAI